MALDTYFIANNICLYNIITLFGIQQFMHKCKKIEFNPQPPKKFVMHTYNIINLLIYGILLYNLILYHCILSGFKLKL
jgi:hypothetical protein